MEAAAARGLADQVVLDHADQYDIEAEGTDGWPQYVDALVIRDSKDTVYPFVRIRCLVPHMLFVLLLVV